MKRVFRRVACLALAAIVASCAPKQKQPTPPPVPPAPTQTQPPAPTPTPTPTPEPEPLPPPTRNEPRLAVGLAWDLETVSFEILRPLATTDSPEGIEGLPVHGPVTVHKVSNGLELTSGSGTIRKRLFGVGRGDTLTFREPSPGSGSDASGQPLGSASAPTFRWNGKTWRGIPKIFVNPRGRLTLATVLPLETYLVGVLPYEIGPLADDLIEAGRAQAIAARSFTLFYKGRRGIEGFDVFGTVEDQVYGSVEGERPLASRCVQSTRGRVAMANGEPVRANYSSTCGGITAEVWEAWPEMPRTYLVSHLDAGGNGVAYCAASPHFRWREEWTAAEFVSNLKKFGPQFGVPMPARGPGTLVDVRVASRSRSGRVWRLEVVTSHGTIVIPAHVMRQVLRRPGKPESILRSNLFKIDVRRSSARKALAVVVSGAGNGHGVGLCQTGALGMARQGIRGEAIIEHYYTGATIDRMYE